LFRHQYSLSREITALLVTFSALSYIVGSVVAARIVNRIGKKRTTILAVIFAGVFTIAFTVLSLYLIAVVTYFISAFCFGASTSSGQSLNLEQVPEYRGSMMSMSAVAGNLGAAVGSSIGGFVLLIYSYEMLGPVLGSLGFISALFMFFVKESV
jgi:MFS family permease